MLVLPVLPLALAALALPPHLVPDVGLLAGDSDSDPSTASHTTRPVVPTFATSAASPSGSLTTSQPAADQRTPPSTPRTDAAEPAAVKTALASTATPSILLASAESHPADHSSKTWQIIGIVIIAVLFVATSIACAMFFDRLCRFLRDVICCTPRPVLFEEFIPDCEKQPWDTRTLSPSPSDVNHRQAESLPEEASFSTTRARELPWNTDTNDRNTLRRQPRNNHPPAA